MDGDPEFVNVAIRIKPVSTIENQCLRVISTEPPVLLVVDRSQTFPFDNIFTEEISQETIYQKSVKPYIEYVKNGYNCTVFAYGQTGTGKTYTMGTNPNVKNQEDFGLISRALNNFFDYDNDDYTEIEILLSFIEIYNEKVFDLLQNDAPKLKGLKTQYISHKKVSNVCEARNFLNMGNKNRHTAGTKQNTQSSRSHAVFTIYCNVRHKDRTTSAKLNLVDLAGCESVRKTGTHGSVFQEGVNINRGLLSIGQVMTALSNNDRFIPYRQSVITSYLQDSLNKQNFVSLIACISPLSEDCTETFQTLEFAQRVKKVKSRPEVNEVIAQYKKENPTLFQMRTNTPFKRSIPVYTPRPAKIRKTESIIEIADQNHSQSSSIASSATNKKEHAALFQMRINTPFKRSIPVYTPRPAKIRKTETIIENADHNDSRSSSIASSVTHNLLSTIDCTDLTQPVSPVVRKCCQAESLKDKIDQLEVYIRSTIRRPTMASMLEKEYNNDNIHYGTPCLQWSQIQNEVSKIVKSEVAKRAMTTSTPEPNIRKALNYDDSPLGLTLDKENDFKVPALPPKKTNLKRKSTIALLPIENLPVAPRRSMRLSIKRLDKSISTLRNFESSIESSYLISEKFRLLQKTVTENEQDFDEFFEHGSMITKNDNKRPRNNKRKMLSVLDTPAGKRLTKDIRKDSPCTSHTKDVLNILNAGKVKELTNLHSIGPKTAQQIDLYRNIKGRFDKISDLQHMPGWGKNKYKRFVEFNLLKKELI